MSQFEITEFGITRFDCTVQLVLSRGTCLSGQTNDQGWALYYFTRNKEGKNNCLAQCRCRHVSAFLGSAACLVGVGFVTCENRYVAVALLTTAVGLEGLVNSGFMVNTIDFAPR